MRNEKRNYNMKTMFNILLIISLIFSIFMLYLSFDETISDNRSAMLASLAGIIPCTVLLLDRLFVFLSSRDKN